MVRHAKKKKKKKESYKDTLNLFFIKLWKQQVDT